jgi:hypothetical protein
MSTLGTSRLERFVVCRWRVNADSDLGWMKFRELDEICVNWTPPVG